jgi:hypothetical protein
VNILRFQSNVPTQVALQSPPGRPSGGPVPHSARIVKSATGRGMWRMRPRRSRVGGSFPALQDSLRLDFAVNNRVTETPVGRLVRRGKTTKNGS